jgi:hypothetical protein
MAGPVNECISSFLPHSKGIPVLSSGLVIISSGGIRGKEIRENDANRKRG